MTFEEAREAIYGLDVRSMGQDGDFFTIKIGNCGRNYDQERTFRAKKLETVVAKIKRAFHD